MGLSNFFGWTSSSTPESELPEIFPLPIVQSEFVKTDVVTIYAKILTDVLERVHGLNDDEQTLLWDSAVKSNASEGLVTLLSKAMTDKAELFLVLDAGVLRKATPEEQTQIKLDYEKTAESLVGVYVSFKDFVRADMVKLYSAFEYVTVSSLHKSMQLSKAVQIKISDLRGSVSLTDSSVAIAQAQAMASSLACGRDILMDEKDSVETSTPDLAAVQAAIIFLNQKRSFYLGLPAAYINGEQTGGLGSTGENDTRAIERGLKSYYMAILKPVLEALFDATLSYKSQDFRQIAGSMDVLKTLSLIDEELISKENKTKLVNQLLDLPQDAEGDPTPKVEPVPLAPGSPGAKNGPPIRVPAGAEA